MTLPPSVIDDLGAHLDRHPGYKYVFGPSGERPFLADGWRTHPWRRAVLATDLSPLRPQDLKHTGVARRPGHSSVAFTYDRYGHLFPEIDKQAAEKLERLRPSSHDCP